MRRNSPPCHGHGGAIFSRWKVGSRYDLQDMLGSGSYGDVAGAYDRLRKRRVAIKRVEDVFCNSVDAMRLVREMTILRQLQHSNTSTLLDVILPPCKDTFTTLYLVFERFDTDLHKLILSPQFLGVTSARRYSPGHPAFHSAPTSHPRTRSD